MVDFHVVDSGVVVDFPVIEREVEEEVTEDVVVVEMAIPEEEGVLLGLFLFFLSYFFMLISILSLKYYQTCPPSLNDDCGYFIDVYTEAKIQCYIYLSYFCNVFLLL